MFKFLNIYKYIIFVFSIMILSVGSSFSSDFPNKPIEMIIGFKPGGFSDAMARKISEPLTQKLGQTIVHKYMGGAGGGIAATNIAFAINLIGYKIKSEDDILDILDILFILFISISHS